MSPSERADWDAAASRGDEDDVRPLPTLVLPVGPSAGHYWRLARGRIVKTAVARAYQRAIQARALAAGWRPLSGPVAMTVRWFRGERRGDLDNRLKVVLDALQGALYDNDNQIVELHAYRSEDREHPRLEIGLTQPDGPGRPPSAGQQEEL